MSRLAPNRQQARLWPEALQTGLEPTPVFGEVWRDLRRQRKQSNDYLSKGSQSHGQHELVWLQDWEHRTTMAISPRLPKEPGVPRYTEKSTL